MAEDKSDKTLPATAHKLKKAKEDGNVPRAKDFPGYMLLVLMIVFLYFVGPLGIEHLKSYTAHVLNTITDHYITASTAADRFGQSALAAATVLLPVFVFMLVVIFFFSTAWQGGWNVSFKPFGFKINKFNPMTGLKKLFGKPSTYVDLGRAIAMVLILAIYTYVALSSAYSELPSLQMMPLDMALKYTFDLLFETLFYLIIMLVILAIIDVAWNKYRHKEKLKMTPKEVKDERKNTEGDPQIKRRIRSVQYQMHRRRMMAAVPKADVVVTNPTHFAIALSYDAEKFAAPEVVAKGQGFVALKIREIAEEHSVPIVENPPLAQTLYKTVEVGDPVPPNLYKAVAQLLAYVYKLRGKKPA